MPIFLMEENPANAKVKWLFIAIVAFIAFYAAATYLFSYYVIDKAKAELSIFFLFKVKTIPIEKISQFEICNAPLSGFRYASSFDSGILIKEGRYDEFFINPKDQERFLNELKQLQHLPDAEGQGEE